MKDSPMAMEIATAFVLNTYSGVMAIPGDTVRGVHYTLCFWGAFCGKLGINVGLSPSWHCQLNGQVKHLARTRNSGVSKNALALGYEPPLFSWSGEPLDIPVVGVCKSTHVSLQSAFLNQHLQANLRRCPHLP